jgi:hypothetical protein
MATTKNGEWKDRFTPRQLERKRKVDRVGQRRTREQLKKSVTELTARVELLTQGQDNIIVDRLIAQNEELNSKFMDIKTRLTSIQELSNHPLSGEGDSNGESPPPARSARSVSRLALGELATRNTERKVDVSKLPFFNSVNLVRSPRSETGTLGHDPNTETIPPQELVDMIMSWKINAQHGLSFEFLMACSGFDRVSGGPTAGTCSIVVSM